MAVHTTPETMDYLRQQRASGTVRWKGLCLALARTARGIPPLYPSALAAQIATPKADRVYHQDKWQRGMVAYFDDPNDDNPYGHIATLAFRSNGVWNAWTNLADGSVGLVPISLFTDGWGDPAQFAARSLNGYDLPLYDKPDKPDPEPPVQDVHDDRVAALIRETIRNLRREAEVQDDRNHPHRATRLRKDAAILRERHKELLRRTK